MLSNNIGFFRRIAQTVRKWKIHEFWFYFLICLIFWIWIFIDKYKQTGMLIESLLLGLSAGAYFILLYSIVKLIKKLRSQKKSLINILFQIILLLLVSIIIGIIIGLILIVIISMIFGPTKELSGKIGFLVIIFVSIPVEYFMEKLYDKNKN